MEDASKKIVPEIQGHGLTAIPGTLTSLLDVPVEKVGAVSYSNNVGLYKYVFYVEPRTAEGVPQAAESMPEKTSRSIRLMKPYVSGDRVALGHAIEIHAKLEKRSEAAPSASVLFFDGDPKEGGKLFDVETISHLPSVEATSYGFRFERHPAAAIRSGSQ